MPVVGSVVVSAALMVAGIFGFRAAGGDDPSNHPVVQWTERQALCDGPRSTQQAQLCRWLHGDAAP